MPNKVQIFMSHLVPTYSFSKMSFQCTALGLAIQNFLLFFDAIYNFLLPFLLSFHYFCLETPYLLPLSIEIIFIFPEPAPTLTI